MIYTKTPFRMSFFGGGTDYQPFFEQHGGSVISTTFDKYSYVSVRHLPRFFDYRNQLTYSRIERTAAVDEIEHPMVRNAMKMLDMDELFIGYDADLPARSGLGSSSSFAVGLLHAFHALKGHYAGKKQLARESIFLERELCGESGGWQDQIAVAYGGLNRINFHADGFDVKPIIITKQRKELLNQNIMMFFTGFSRLSSEIAVEQVKATRETGTHTENQHRHAGSDLWNRHAVWGSWRQAPGGGGRRLLHFLRAGRTAGAGPGGVKGSAVCPVPV